MKFKGENIAGMKMKICSGWRRFLFALPLIFFLPHLLSVMELHQNSSVQEPQKKIQKKFDHLILGPAAGQGLSSRLQCQGTKALNRTRTSNGTSRLEDNIAFVTVFTIYNSSVSSVDDRSSNTVVGDASYNKVERSMAVLNVFINFIQLAMLNGLHSKILIPIISLLVLLSIGALFISRYMKKKALF